MLSEEKKVINDKFGYDFSRFLQPPQPIRRTLEEKKKQKIFKIIETIKSMKTKIYLFNSILIINRKNKC